MKHGFEIKTIPLSMIKANFENYDIICYDWKKLEDHEEKKKFKKRKEELGKFQPAIEQSPKKKQASRVRPKRMNLFQLWWNHKDRKNFDGKILNPMPIELDPEIRNPFALNLWRGFATGFGRDDVLQYTEFNRLSFLFNHLRYVWCANEEEFNFLLGWMATIIQKPWVKQGVCVCVGGKEGTGKTLPFLMLGRIVGHAHFAHCQNSNDIVGEFTPFTNKILVFVDEALFSGNHQQNNILKNLITAPTTRERKMFHDPIYTDSYLNLCLATNHEDAMVMADERMRRFLHLHAKLGPLMNHPTYKSAFGNDISHYFTVLSNSLLADDNLGLKTLANFLYNLPIENYDSRNVPLTHLLFMNKLTCMKRIFTWWLECLQREYVYPDVVYTNGVRLENHQWLFVLYEEEVFNNYKNSGGEIKINITFRENFKHVCPSVQIKMNENGKRKDLVYLMPDLKQCLYEFDKVLPGSLAYITKNKAALETRKRAEFLGMLPKNAIEQKAQDLEKKGILNNLKNIDAEYYEREIQLGKLSGVELLNKKYLPEDFFGYPLMASILNKKFKIRNSEEYLKYLGYESDQLNDNDKKAQDLITSLLKTNSNSNPNINPNKEEIPDDFSDLSNKSTEPDLIQKMDDFLIKLPTIRTQEDGFVNTSKGDFGFPKELVVVFDENGQEVAASVENTAALPDNSLENMEME